MKIGLACVPTLGVRRLNMKRFLAPNGWLRCWTPVRLLAGTIGNLLSPGSETGAPAIVIAHTLRA